MCYTNQRPEKPLGVDVNRRSVGNRERASSRLSDAGELDIGKQFVRRSRAAIDIHHSADNASKGCASPAVRDVGQGDCLPMVRGIQRVQRECLRDAACGVAGAGDFASQFAAIRPSARRRSRDEQYLQRYRVEVNISLGQ